VRADRRQLFKMLDVQSPGTGDGVGPRLRERPELRLGVHDAFDAMANRSKVLRARRSIRLTVTTSPGSEAQEKFPKVLISVKMLASEV
jgi:hypothetical protein